MEIDFYYIKGISLTDTLYFSNYGQQSAYLRSHLVTHIDSTFYPPHYYNTIKVEKSDIDLSTAVNYLSFNYGGRRYCYFINSISYVNEDVYLIRIEMDTIQTYMFDIEVESCHIDRKFIDRYDSTGRINRNYIRENFSDADMILYSQQSQDKDPNALKWFIIRTAKEEGNISVNYTNLIDTTKSERYYSSYCYYFVPYIEGMTFYHFGTQGSNSPRSAGAINVVLPLMSRNSDIVDITFVPWNIFGNDILKTQSFSDNELVLDFSKDSGLKAVQLNKSEAQSYAICFDHWGTAVPVNMTALTYSSIYTINMVQNKHKDIPFLSRYAPVMMDNNYISLSYGEAKERCSIDLYGCNSCNFTLISQRSPLMIRRYRISCYSYLANYAYKDYTMKSYVCCVDTPTYDVINDTYNTWKSQNTFTGLNAVLKDGLSLAGKVLSTKYSYQFDPSQGIFGSGGAVDDIPSYNSGRYQEYYTPYTSHRTAYGRVGSNAMLGNSPYQLGNSPRALPNSPDSPSYLNPPDLPPWSPWWWNE